MFGDGGGDGVDGLVHDLAEAEAHGYGTQDVGVNWGEAPAGDQEIDHAEGCGAGSVGEVGAGLHYDPFGMGV